MTRDYWPTEDWRTNSPGMTEGVSRELRAIADSIPEYGNVTSALVVQNGYLVMEAYSLDHESDGCWGLREGAPPHTSGHYVFSVTKSILSAVVGVAIDKGYIKNVDQPIADFLDGSSRQNDLRIKHLLTMTSGLDTSQPIPEVRGRAMIEHCLDLPRLAEPGSQFKYDNHCANLLSAVVSVAAGMNAYELGKRVLFDPMGLKVDWGGDHGGDSAGGAGIVLTARGMAKFGYLFLNNGVWADTRLLPESWIRKSTKAHNPGGAPCGDFYGYLWWTSSVNGHKMYYAAGMHGQRIMVFPLLDLVVVLTGDSRKGRIRNHLVEKIVTLKDWCRTTITR